MIKKKLFGENILLREVGSADIYPEDISKIFRWMMKIKFPSEPIILDIGANIGMFSLSYASIFKRAKIHCFEPVPFIFNFLNRNLEANSSLNKNIYSYNFGFSNCFEQKQLSIPIPVQHERYTKNLDIRLYSVFGQGDEKFDAKFKPLDKWVEEININDLNFIKIDVEGYEYLVLEGASKTLLKYRPIVMFELNEMTLALSKRTIDEYFFFAKTYGYQIFGLEYGYKSKLLKIDSQDKVNLVSDLILLPKSSNIF